MEDQNTPATRADLAGLRAELKQDIELLRSEMNHSYRDLQEKFEAGVTRMLTAFYSIA